MGIEPELGTGPGCSGKAPRCHKEERGKEWPVRLVVSRNVVSDTKGSEQKDGQMPSKALGFSNLEVSGSKNAMVPTITSSQVALRRVVFGAVQARLAVKTARPL